MKEVYVSLPSVEVVHSFVGALTGLDGDFDLVSGSYVLDARSLMGIFAFDLAKPILLRIHNDSDANISALQRFIIDAEGNRDE